MRSTRLAPNPESPTSNRDRGRQRADGDVPGSCCRWRMRLWRVQMPRSRQTAHAMPGPNSSYDAPRPSPLLNTSCSRVSAVMGHPALTRNGRV